MKKALLLSVLFAFAVVLTVGPSKASAIEKAPVKTEQVALLKKYEGTIAVNLNVDAEFCPIVFAATTPSIFERPYFLYQYAVLSNTMDVPRGPPEFRC